MPLIYLIVLSKHTHGIFFACRSLNSSSTAIPSPLGSGARIANGKKAPKGAIPFAAYIEIESYEGIYTCGGSLIAPRVLVTAGRISIMTRTRANTAWLSICYLNKACIPAAHCFFSDSGNSLATSALAAIGETDISRPSRVYEILEVIRPTDYAPAFTYELYGDIAVALLDRRANRKPVTMGSSKTKIPKYYMTAGWGLTEKDYSPDELMYAAVPSLSLRQVNSWAASSGLYYSMEEDKMAAGLGSDRADSCQGDSGGPLFIPGKDKFTNAESRRNILMGVVSYGLSSACGGRNRNIGFYTSIPYWRNWIKDAISSNKWK